MGLFDNLRKVVDTAKDSINKVIETAQNEKDPLADETVKMYFEIICGMRHTFKSIDDEPVVGNVKAKKYVEYFLGAECDQEKLQKTLEFYNRSRSDYPSDPVDKVLSDFRKSLFEKSIKGKGNYELNRYEAFKMFRNEELEAARAEYEKILDTIKDNINYKHFSQGMKIMQADTTAKYLAIAESFLEENPITEKLILEYVVDSYVGRVNSPEFEYHSDWHRDVALLIIRALNFDKHKGEKENYISASDEGYCNFVTTVPYYNSVIEDNPFEKEKYINRFTNEIKKGNIFYGVYTSFGKDCFSPSEVNDYFCDAVCYLAWKSITGVENWYSADGEIISDTKNVQDIFDIICTYLENPDEYGDLKIAPLFDEETGEVEVYNTISDDVRSQLGTLDLDE